MCEPGTLLLIGAGLSAASAGFGGIMAYQQGQARAKVAERNASLERNAAQEEMANTRQAALARYREIAKVKGQQRVAAAANGVGLDFGTAADVVADTDMLGREDVAQIYKQGDNAVRNRDIRASNFTAEASMARSQATGAFIGGMLDMGSSVLGGASQYASMKDGLTSSAKRTIRKNPGIF